MQRYSVATIKQPEFLNITTYSPLISKCEIKVLYTGKNDNRTDISKETATEMAKTLPGCPIVGAYNKEKSDFGDHGDVIVIEDGEVKTSCKTVPYGFVAPDSKIWFKEYDEENRKGEIVKREYLMCEGYLWTGQYEEAKRIIDQGNSQSMELDENSLKGEWSKDDNGFLEFFIINDAIFSKLCILGENVEPCFEGASITAPDISKRYNLDKELTTTLYTMINELKFSLQGGQTMENNNIQTPEGIVTDSIAEPTSAFVKDEDKNKKPDNKPEENKDEEKDKKKKEDYACGGDGKDKKKEYSLDNVVEYQELLGKYQELEMAFNTLKEENKTLSEFKLSAEKKEKQAMIDSFYMLTDDDKKEVIDNIDKYSVADIEKELSVICVRNKVNFNLEDSSKNDNNIDKQLTYSLNANDSADNAAPAWIKSIIRRRKENGM